MYLQFSDRSLIEGVFMRRRFDYKSLAYFTTLVTLTVVYARLSVADDRLQPQPIPRSI